MTPEQVFEYARQHAPKDRPDITWSDMHLVGVHSQTHDCLTIKMLNTKTNETILAFVKY